VRARSRWPNVQHFALNMELVARTHRMRPSELVKPCTNDPSGGLEISVDQKSHGHRGRVPPAGRETTKNGVSCQRFIQMEWLRVELGGKRFDALSLNSQASRAEYLPDCVVFQIPCS